MKYLDLDMTKVAAAFAVDEPETLSDSVAHSSLITGMMFGLAAGKKEAGLLSDDDRRVVGIVEGVCKAAARLRKTLNEKTAGYDPDEAVETVSKDLFQDIMSDKVAYTKVGSLALLDYYFDKTDTAFCEKVASDFEALFKEADGDEEGETQDGEGIADDGQDLEAGMSERMNKNKPRMTKMPSNEAHLEAGGDMDQTNSGIVGEDALAEALRRVNATTYNPIDDALEAQGGEENELAEVMRLLEAQQGGNMEGEPGPGPGAGTGPGAGGMGKILASLGHAGQMM